MALGAASAHADVVGEIRDGQARLAALGAQAEVAAERFDAGRIAVAAARVRANQAQQRLKSEDARLAALEVQAGAFVAQVYMAGPAGQAVAVMATSSPDALLGQLGVLSSIARSQSDVLAELATARSRQAQVSADATQQQAAATRTLTDLQAAKQTVEHADEAARVTLVRLQAAQQRLVQAAQDAAARRRAQAAAADLALQAQRSAAALTAFQSQPLVDPAPTGQVAAPPTPHDGSVAQTALSVARSELGKPYVYGAAGPDTFDCSGLTMYAYGQAGVSLPHYAADQYNQGHHVGRGELQPGDLVFFDNLGHVGIYAGAGQFIHAPHSGTVVQYGSMAGYWDQHYVGAVRLTG